MGSGWIAANFSDADLRGANLLNANLERANLFNPNLGKSNLRDAIFTEEQLVKALSLHKTILPIGEADEQNRQRTGDE